jgi:hypothetical protein
MSFVPIQHQNISTNMTHDIKTNEFISTPLTTVQQIPIETTGTIIEQQTILPTTQTIETLPLNTIQTTTLPLSTTIETQTIPQTTLLTGQQVIQPGVTLTQPTMPLTQNMYANKALLHHGEIPTMGMGATGLPGQTVPFTGVPGCHHCGGAGYVKSKTASDKMKACKDCVKATGNCPRCGNTGYRLAKPNKKCNCMYAK